MSNKNDNRPRIEISPQLAHAVIGAWLQGREAASVPFLQPEHFPNHQDQAAWRAILQLELKDGIVGDMLTLGEHLKHTASLDNTDWNKYLFDVLAQAGESAGLAMETNARAIYDYWRRNRMLDTASDMARRAANLSLPLPLDEATSRKPKGIIPLIDLLTMDFPPPGGPWPGFIPVGLTVVGARPKFGKSMLMLQASVAIGSGGMLFDKRLERGRVLYYALEDNGARLQSRLRSLDVPSDALIDFLPTIPRLYQGGLAEVEALAPDYQMIVIDTIARAMEGKDFNRDAASFGEMLGRLQAAALRNNMAIVTVMHTRKPNGMEHDPVDDMLGSTQMTAPADCVLALFKQNGQSLLKGRARDAQDIDLTVQFDPATLCWQLVGKTSEVTRTENEAAILEALGRLGRATATEVANELGKHRGNTTARIQKMWVRGLLHREMIGPTAYYSVRLDDAAQPDGPDPVDGVDKVDRVDALTSQPDPAGNPVPESRALV